MRPEAGPSSISAILFFFNRASAGEWKEELLNGLAASRSSLVPHSIQSTLTASSSLHQWIDGRERGALKERLISLRSLSLLVDWVDVCFLFAERHGGQPPITHHSMNQPINHNQPPAFIVRSLAHFSIRLGAHCPSTIKSNHSAHSKERNEIDLCVEWAGPDSSPPHLLSNPLIPFVSLLIPLAFHQNSTNSINRLDEDWLAIYKVLL